MLAFFISKKYEVTMMSPKHCFILVHGAWGASWYWDKIGKKLRTLGHIVLTPDLPGHGTSCISPGLVTLKDYVNSLATLIKTQPLRVTLVGHSMSGIVISQVAEVLGEQIEKLIYIAAYIPKNGESLFSIAEQAESVGVSPYLIIDQEKAEIRLKQSPELSTLFYHLCPKEDIAFAESRLQTQPLEPFTARVTLGKRFQQVPKRAIICQQDRAIVPLDQMKMCNGVINDIIYLNADHSPFYSAIDELTNALLKE